MEMMNRCPPHEMMDPARRMYRDEALPLGREIWQAAQKATYWALRSHETGVEDVRPSLDHWETAVHNHFPVGHCSKVGFRISISCPLLSFVINHLSTVSCCI